MKNWWTLKPEDGPIARYLIGLGNRRREQWNRELVRLLLGKEEAMKIVDGLVDVVREACAVEAGVIGLNGTRRAIRTHGDSGWTDDAHIACAGLDAIRKYFKDYEEVEVAWDRGTGSASRVSRHADAAAYARGYGGVATTMLIPKPAAEMLTVSRETLAVLAEHYEATPVKDKAGNAALAEVKEVIA